MIRSQSARQSSTLAGAITSSMKRKSSRSYAYSLGEGDHAWRSRLGAHHRALSGDAHLRGAMGRANDIAAMFMTSLLTRSCQLHTLERERGGALSCGSCVLVPAQKMRGDSREGELLTIIRQMRRQGAGARNLHLQCPTRDESDGVRGNQVPASQKIHRVAFCLMCKKMVGNLWPERYGQFVAASSN